MNLLVVRLVSLFISITNVLHTVNFSLNFLLYCIVSAQFRDVCKGACYGVLKFIFSPAVVLRRYDTWRTQQSLRVARDAELRRVHALYHGNTIVELRADMGFNVVTLHNNISSDPRLEEHFMEVLADHDVGPA